MFPSFIIIFSVGTYVTSAVIIGYTDILFPLFKS